MDVTNLITAISSMLEQTLGQKSFVLRKLVYQHSIAQIVPKITITYLTDSNTLPTKDLGDYQLSAIEVTKADAENMQQVSVTYMNRSYFTVTKKTGKKVLFLSLTPQESVDYNCTESGQITTDANTVVLTKICNDDFSGGFRASDVINYARSLVGGPAVSGMPEYYIRQYRLTAGKTLMGVVQDLYGFMRPQLYYAASGLTIRPEIVCSAPTNEYCIPDFDEFSSMTYSETKLNDGVKGVTVYGGMGLFNRALSPVKVGNRTGICLDNSTSETNGTYSTGYICYDIDEFGRSILRSTHKVDYDNNKILSGLVGGKVKDLTSVRIYRYNSIDYEEPIPIGETISGYENIYSTDSDGKVVRIGHTASIEGNKAINYNPTTFLLDSVSETQRTMIYPISLVVKGLDSNTGDFVTEQRDNQTVYKTESRTEMYGRSNSKVYGVAVAQTTETPVFRQPDATNTEGGVNNKVVVDHVEVNGTTSFQESMGSVNRGIPRLRTMQIKAHVGSTTDNVEVSNPNIVVYSDARNIANAVYASSVRANWVAQAVYTFHTDTIYAVGSQMNGGYVSAQTIVMDMGSGATGFELTNTLTITSKFAR